jgi:hypothetical protein
MLKVGSCLDSIFLYIKTSELKKKHFSEVQKNKLISIQNVSNDSIINDFYKIVYGDKEFPDDYVVNFGHGPCFCVTRELILSHNIDIYEKLLDTFYPGKEHWTEWEGHSETETIYHIGKRYHDNLLRFWLLLFVQNYKNQNVITDYDNFVTMKSE